MDKSKGSKFKKLLTQEKIKILNRFEMNLKEVKEFTKDDILESRWPAKYIIKNEIIESVKVKELEKLKAIEEALGRLDQGVYGFCEECDELIGENRLKIQPWTTLCLSDAEELERQLQKTVTIIEQY
jgi:DnaK suppressor protein